MPRAAFPAALFCALLILLLHRLPAHRSTIPISPSSIIRLVPPEEKKGRLMPVFGMVLVTTAMFSTACSTTCTVKPTVSSAPNLSGAFSAMEIPAAAAA